MKYIMAKTTHLSTPVPIIFPDHIKHTEMFQMISGMVVELISAGFVSITPDEKIQCWGKSIGLRIDSRPVEDSAIVQKFFDE
jgi:hypothetical protein